MKALSELTRRRSRAQLDAHERPAAPSTAGSLLDRWIDRWVAKAEARWRQAGDPHGARYY